MRRWVVGALVAAAAVCLGMALVIHLRGMEDPEADRLVREAMAADTAAELTATETIERVTPRGATKVEAHLAREGGRSARTFRRDSEEAIVVDTGTEVLRLDPQRKRITAIQTEPRPRDAERLLRSYRPREVGQVVLAGRPARVVTLTSRHRGNLARKLWIDEQSRIILRTESYDADGELVGRTTLSDIRLGPPKEPIPSAKDGWERVAAVRDAKPASAGEAERALGEPPLVPAFVPRGYEPQGIYAVLARGSRRAIELRYSDGLQTLSIYEHRRGWAGRGGPQRGPRTGSPAERAGHHGRKPGERRHDGPGRRTPALLDRGAVKAVRVFENDIVVVIVGDLTSDEIARMGKSLRHEGGV